MGVKRIEAIIIYRKDHELSSLEELLKVKGIGKATVKNIKEDVQKKVCTNFSNPKKKKKILKLNSEWD